MYSHQSRICVHIFVVLSSNFEKSEIFVKVAKSPEANSDFTTELLGKWKIIKNLTFWL